MRSYGENWLKASVADKLKYASVVGVFDGMMTRSSAAYLDHCTAFHAASGSLLIFTRDTGHHSSGWFKNPDYERCYHLSLSFKEPFNVHAQAPFNRKLADEWAELFFAHNVRLIWWESPKSEHGRLLEVNHARVFCDERWFPIMPRGEVYTREFTEKGWKSWSDLHPDEPEPSILHAG